MTAKYTSPLKNLKIASPCSQDWNAMIGTERKRYCGECKLNVYNLSGMSKTEAENLIVNAEGRLCVRFFKREDGTVLTQDCPVGWQALKKRVSKTAAAFASLFIGLLSGLGVTVYMTKQNEPNLMGAIPVEINYNAAMTGAIAVKPIQPNMTMGNVSIERKGEFTVGQLVKIERVNPKKSKRDNE
jgi:hypothetical protein